MKKLSILIFLICCRALQSCEEFVETNSPVTQVSRQTVFSNDATAISAVTGIYSQMINSPGFAGGGVSGVTVLAGTSGDEFLDFSAGPSAEFSSNEMTASNSLLYASLWTEPYKYIYNANAVLEGLKNASDVTEEISKQLKGEALFVRAFCYFYLVNFFGELPLVLGTDYRENRSLSRTPVPEIYQRILADLTEATTLLPPNYSLSKGERVRPIRYAAIAMRARAHLFLSQWDQAAAYASLVIENPLYALSEPADVFLKNSSEAIWQLMPPGAGANTQEALVFILTTIPSTVSLSKGVVDTFEKMDKRRSAWIDSLIVAGTTYYYPHKYKVGNGATTLEEYSMVLRLSEMYLIRAEALAQQGMLAQAIADLDTIRERANISRVQEVDPAISKENLLSLIATERRREFFAEWAHRWLDLKRTGTADQVLAGIKGSQWEPSDILYPVPAVEIQNNANLLPQNLGY